MMMMMMIIIIIIIITTTTIHHHRDQQTDTCLGQIIHHLSLNLSQKFKWFVTPSDRCCFISEVDHFSSELN